VAAAREEVERLAGESGVAVSRIEASGTHPLERMATLCAIGDFASVYLALAIGVDPTPIAPIEVLKQRLLARDDV
jgi:glucose/mannose-6-phosphate isomerase